MAGLGGTGTGRQNGGPGGKASAFGGGIYMSGSLTIDTSTLTGNEVIGGVGGSSHKCGGGGGGGAAAGAGIFNRSGSIQITNSTLSGNQAQGGIGGTTPS